MHQWAGEGALVELRRALVVFGLDSLTETVTAPVEVEELARLRLHARASRDFGEADRLRSEISEAGWEVRDISQPPGFELVPK